jgi:formate hydrogenlyase subunit 3/multisubunit Na+/H+ antiporter MnhD subunit
LVLAVFSLIVGGLIYAIAYVSRQPKIEGAALAGGGIFTGGEPLSSEGRLTAGDFSSIFLQNWHEFFRWSNVDAVYLGVWRGLQAVSRGLGVVVSMLERKATIFVVAFAAIVFAFIQWIVPVPTGFYEGFPTSIPSVAIAAIGAAAIGLFLTSLVSGAKGKIPLWLSILIVGSLSVAGLLVANPWIRLWLLESAALLTVVLVWFTARTRSAKFTYLAIVVISGICAVGSEFMYDVGQNAALARTLLITGIVVKLAAIPMLFWLLSLADELPSLVLGLIIAVLDMAAYGEFLRSSLENLRVFFPGSLWFWIAAITSLLASLLMLTQKSLKRLLILSTIEDVGFLFLGLTALSRVRGVELGLTLFYGTALAAATHSLAKALLFICLSGPEADGALEGEPKGLAARYPVAAFGFLFGMLAMLGIPPTMGFLGRWRLYETAVQIGWPLAAVFILSSIFALIAYVLALTRFWWGPPDEPDPSSTPEHPIKEPLILQSVIVALVVIILAVGIWPDLLQKLLGGRL